MHLLHPSFKRVSLNSMLISITNKNEAQLQNYKEHRIRRKGRNYKKLILGKIHKLVSSSISMSSLPTKAKKRCNNDEGTEKETRGE